MANKYQRMKLRGDHQFHALIYSQTIILLTSELISNNEMIELPLYTNRTSKLGAGLFIGMILVVFIMHILFPQFPWWILLILAIAFIFLSNFYDKKNTATGNIIFEYHVLKISTIKNKIELRGEQFNRIRMVYSGYQGKWGADRSQSSGYDNEIWIKDGAREFHFHFFVKSDTEELRLLELISYWGKCGYTSGNIKVVE